MIPLLDIVPFLLISMSARALLYVVQHMFHSSPMQSHVCRFHTWNRFEWILRQEYALCNRTDASYPIACPSQEDVCLRLNRIERLLDGVVLMENQTSKRQQDGGSCTTNAVVLRFHCCPTDDLFGDTVVKMTLNINNNKRDEDIVEEDWVTHLGYCHILSDTMRYTTPPHHAATDAESSHGVDTG